MRENEQGEVFPVAILFGGVLLTILIGLHVVLMSVGRTAVQAAADRGVTAAQVAPPGQVRDCGEFSRGGRTVRPDTPRECEGVIATLRALDSSGAMVRRAGPPDVEVNETAGVVAVHAYGAVVSPVFGQIEIIGYACGPLELITGVAPTPADASAC
jgi:hypothetical protein